MTGSRTALALVLMLHVAADAVLVLRPWYLRGPAIMIVLALPVSQNSLISIWAASCRLPGYVCLLTITAGIAVSCAVTYTLMSELAATSAIVTAGWCYAMVVQALLIFVAVQLWKSRQLRIRRQSSESVSGITRSGRRSYNLRSLFLYTAAFTIPLAALRLTATQYNWTLHSLADEVLSLVGSLFLLIGMSNAAYAIIVAWSLAVCNRAGLRITGALLLVVTLIAIQVLVEQRLLSGTHFGTITQTVAFAVAQVVFLYVTLVPACLAGK